MAWRWGKPRRVGNHIILLLKLSMSRCHISVQSCPGRRLAGEAMGAVACLGATGASYSEYEEDASGDEALLSGLQAALGVLPKPELEPASPPATAANEEGPPLEQPPVSTAACNNNRI